MFFGRIRANTEIFLQVGVVQLKNCTEKIRISTIISSSPGSMTIYLDTDELCPTPRKTWWIMTDLLRDYCNAL